MPNWVINQVTCDNLQALADLRDFNRIVPMPVVYEHTDAGSASSHFKALWKAGMTYEEMLQEPPRYKPVMDDYGNLIYVPRPEERAKWPKMLRRFLLAQRLHGFADWYDWRLANWGTKWPASDYLPDYELLSCTFETAWSHPVEIIEALSVRYPDTELVVSYADENIGYNAGRYTIRNGIYGYADDVMCGSKEAFEIAFSLWGGEEDYRFDKLTGTYEYINTSGDDNDG